MGRRSRRDKSRAPEQREPATRVARVRVDGATWAAYKASLGEQSVADALGRYVEAVVAKTEARKLEQQKLTERELVDALAQAERLQRSLGRLVEQLRWRLPKVD